MCTAVSIFLLLFLIVVIFVRYYFRFIYTLLVKRSIWLLFNPFRPRRFGNIDIRVIGPAYVVIRGIFIHKFKHIVLWRLIILITGSSFRLNTLLIELFCLYVGDWYWFFKMTCENSVVSPSAPRCWSPVGTHSLQEIAADSHNKLMLLSYLWRHLVNECELWSTLRKSSTNISFSSKNITG